TYIPPYPSFIKGKKMTVILKRGLALALIVLIVASSTFDNISVANARIPYKHVRQLAVDCEHDPRGYAIPGCGGGSGGSSRPGRPSGPAPGSKPC
ncbi:hypothetical protein M8C21_015354, partial [Ambrosia artemisiifolia]